MGKMIAKKIRGMGLATKIGLVLVFTLLISVFMYQGWYRPVYVQAAARVGTGGAASGSGSTLAVTIPSTAAGNTLIAVVGSINNANTVSSITGGGTWTRAVSSINSNTQVTEIWYCSNVTGGVTSVSISKSAVNSTAIVYEYSGVLTTSPLDKTATATGQSGTQSSGTTTATAQANELWIGGFSTGVTGTYSTSASGWSTVRSYGTTVGAGFFENTANSATTASVSVTGPSGAPYAGAIATFKPAGAAAPTVTSISPTSRGQGATSQSITINGANFVSGATASFGTGVTTNSTNFVSATQLTANITVSSGATTGTRTVTVTNPDTQSGSLTNGFTVNAAPTVTSTSPSSRGQGTTSQSITINGTGFVSGAVASFSGTGISVNSTTYVSATQLTANITVAAGATVGSGNVTVTNPDAGVGTGTGVFTVNAAPTVTATSPNNMTQGTGPTTVTITGTGFQSGAAVAFSGTGVTTGSVTVVNATTITVPVTVAAGATTGARNVTITNTDGGAGTGSGVFTVNAPVCTANTPTISVLPVSSTVTSGGAANTYTVTVTNNDTAACSSTVFTLTKSDSNTPTFTSSTLSPTTLTLAPGANGTATFTVSATAGAANGASNTTTLGVTATGHTAPANITATTTVSNLAPTVTSASPNSGTQGAANLNVTITGTNFRSGATSAFSGTGITVNSTTYVSATQLTANITIAAGAATGSRNVTVTNPDTQSATLTGGFTVSAPACTANVPTLSIAPTSASVKSGAGATYTVTVLNNDSASCASTTFNLSLANSNTTDFSTTAMSPLSLTLAPGVNGTATFTSTAGAVAANGAVNTATVGVTATGHTAPANVTGVTTVNNTTQSTLVHSSNNLGTKYGTWGTNYDCSTCHNSSTSNIKQVAGTITTPTGDRPVVFNRLTSSVDQAGVFGDDLRSAGNGSTNVCEVCHHNTLHHQYSSAKIADRTTNPHYNRRDCISCHLHSAAFKGAGCDGCHGNPPNSSVIGAGGLATPATNAQGATPPSNGGAHMAHTGAPRNMACNTCHSGYGVKAMPSNSIDIGFAINNGNVSGFGGTGVTTGTLNAPNTLNSPYAWSAAAGTTVTANPGNMTCSVYCHGATLTGGTNSTPNWAVTDGTQDGCGTCHGVTSATAPTTGSHGRHAGNGATSLAIACANCHGAHADNSHVDGSVAWNLTGIAATAQYKTPAGSYATSGSTGGLAPSASYGSCTNIYCHSTVQGATGTGSPTYASPTWGGATLTCGSCHNDMSGGAGTGSHPKHANTAQLACSLCHGAGYSSTVASYPRHANGFINISTTGYAVATAYTKGKSITPGSAAYGTCSNSYCHSTVQSTTGLGAGTPVTTTAWGSGALNCGSCHKNMSTDATAPGSHVAHTQASGTVYTCDVCHGTGYSATAVVYPSHVNNQINLSFTANAAGTAYSKTTAFAPGSAAYGTCATSNCHGAMNPTWGNNTAKARCQKCHGYRSSGWNALNGATATSDAKAGAHFNHISSAGTVKYRSSLSCAECHASSIALTTDSVTATGHFDTAGPADVTFGTLAKTNSQIPAYNSPAAGQCSNVYCHGAGMASNISNPPSSRILSPSWSSPFLTGTAGAVGNGSTTPGTGDCSTCHGYPPMTATHTGKVATDCTGCHTHVNAGGTGFTDATKHINGTVDAAGDCNSCHDYEVIGSVYAGGAWTGGSWGKNSRDGLNPNEGWGAHAKHINYIKTRLGMAVALNPVGQTFGVGEPANICGSCHTNSVANHSTSGSTVRTINFGDSTFKIGGATGTSFLFGTTNPVYNGVSGTSSATTPKTCSNISCHYFTSPIWSTY